MRLVAELAGKGCSDGGVSVLWVVKEEERDG